MVTNTTRTAQSAVTTTTATEPVQPVTAPPTNQSESTGTVSTAATPAVDEGLSQNAVIVIAVVVPTCLLCVAVAYIARQKCTPRATRHSGAQVMRINGDGREMQSARAHEYGPINGVGGNYDGARLTRSKALTYDAVSDADLMPTVAAVPWSDRLAAYDRGAELHSPVSVEDPSTEDSSPRIYDRVSPLPVSHYESTTSKLSL